MRDTHTLKEKMSMLIREKSKIEELLLLLLLLLPVDWRMTYEKNHLLHSKDEKQRQS